jgi:hypothetical protein
MVKCLPLFAVLSLFALGCTSSVVGTGAAVDDVQGASEVEQLPAEETAPTIAQQPAASESTVTLSVDGVPYPTFKTGTARVERDGSLTVTLKRKDGAVTDPEILLSVGLTARGCLQFGKNGSQGLAWRPDGESPDGAYYETPAFDPDCGLTITRADTTAGGRVKGSFDGYPERRFGGTTADADFVRIRLSFDVPVR